MKKSILLVVMAFVLVPSSLAAINAYYMDKPYIYTELVSGGTLPENQSIYMICSFAINAGYYGGVRGEAGQQMNITTNSSHKSFYYEVYTDGGSITGFSNATNGIVTINTSLQNLTNGSTIYIRNSSNYAGNYTIIAVTNVSINISKTFTVNDGAASWYSDLMKNSNSSRYPTPYYITSSNNVNAAGINLLCKWDFYSMLDGNGTPYQWDNLNDPAKSGYTSQFQSTRGHTKWNVYYATRTWWNTGKGIVNQIATSTSPADNKLLNGTGLSGSVDSLVWHQGLSFQEYNSDGTKRYTFSSWLNKSAGAIYVIVDNSSTNTWTMLIDALEAAGRRGQVWDVSYYLDKEASSYDNRKSPYLQGLIGLYHANQNGISFNVYNKNVIFFHSFPYIKWMNWTQSNVMALQAQDSFWNEAIGSYFDSTFMTNGNSLLFYQGNQIPQAKNFVPLASSCIPTTYNSLDGYNFIASGAGYSSDASVQLPRYPDAGWIISNIKMVRKYSYITVTGANITWYYDTVEYQGIPAKSYYGFEISVIANPGSYSFTQNLTMYDVTTERSDGIVRVYYDSNLSQTTGNIRIFDIYSKYRSKLTVTTQNGIPIQGATVTMTNLGGEQFLGTTNSTGQIITNLTGYTIKMNTSNPDGYLWGSSKYYSQTSLFNNFTLTITAPGYQTYTNAFYNVVSGFNHVIALTEGVDSTSGTANVMGTEYAAGEDGTVYAQVLYANNTPANAASCNISIYLRNATIVDDGVMNYLSGSNGGYYYNFTVPTNISVFMTDVVCSNPTAYGSSDFHVSNWAGTIQQINTTVNIINVLSSAINSSQSNDFDVRMTDFDAITADSKYYAKVFSSHLGVPTNLSELPRITIYDSLRTVIVDNQQFNFSSEGVYNYTYDTTASATSGVWESVVTANYSGNIVYLNDYWSISSSPADVVINSMSDLTIPTVAASVSITNMGTQGSDFYYVYCVVNSSEKQCEGGDTVAYQSASRYIGAGSTWTNSLSLNVPKTGTYWFKVKARALAETLWAGASLQFIALPTEAVVGGDGGGAGPAGEATKNVTSITTITTTPDVTQPSVPLPGGRTITGTNFWLFLIIAFVLGYVAKKKKEQTLPKKQMQPAPQPMGLRP